MVSARIRHLLLRPDKSVSSAGRRRVGHAATGPATLIKGLRMCPTGCVCSVEVRGTSQTPPKTTTPQSPVPPQTLREAVVVMPEMVPRVVVRAAASAFDDVVESRRLPAQTQGALEWPLPPPSSSRRRPHRVPRPVPRSVPRLPCPLAAKQLCARCPWMSLGLTLSTTYKTQRFAAQLAQSLPAMLPFLHGAQRGKGTAISEATHTQTGRGLVADIIVEDDDGEDAPMDTTRTSEGPAWPTADSIPAGHEAQLQTLPVDYREGVSIPLQGNHLQEVWLAYETDPLAVAPIQASTSTSTRASSKDSSTPCGVFGFVSLTARSAESLTHTPAATSPMQGRRGQSSSHDALRALAQTNDAATSMSEGAAETETPASNGALSDGIALCGLATLEQKRFLTLLNRWARQLPLATQSCLRGALVLQPPSSTSARQAWNSSLLVTVLMERDTVGWGPQSPLCGPAHPADVLSVMEQELVEAVLAAAPLLPDVRVQVGFIGRGGDLGQRRDDGSLVGDCLHPVVARRVALARGADSGSTSAGETARDLFATARIAEDSALDDVPVPFLRQPIACYIDAGETLVDTHIVVSPSALELYEARAAALSPSTHERKHSKPAFAHSQQAQMSLLATTPFFRHAAALDTSCSVLLSALLERTGWPRGGPPPQVWLQLTDWRRSGTLAGPALSDTCVGTRRLCDALLSVVDALQTQESTPSSQLLSRARRWHRTEGRDLQLHETEESSVAPLIARRRADRGHDGNQPHASTPLSPHVLLALLSTDAACAREEARALVKWLTFADSMNVAARTSRPPPTRLVMAACTNDGDGAPLLSALETLCESGIGAPLEADRREQSRRYRLDRVSTSVVDVDPLAASCVPYISLDLSFR